VKTIATVFDDNAGHGPSFDMIRLAAAAAVLVSHSAAVSGQKGITNFSNGQISLGALAVAVFFAMSGFVVMESFKRDPRPVVFLRKRALRIYPALVLLVLLSVFVLGPLLTTVPLGSYFSSKVTGLYLLNAILPFSYDLPGVFTTNPVSWVNGSLWTLRYEILCYLVVVVFGAKFVARPYLALAVALTGAVVSEGLLLVDMYRHASHGFIEGQIWQCGTALANFFGGACMALFSDKIFVSTPRIGVALALFVLSLASYGFLFIFPAVGAYLIVVLGNTKALEFAGIRRGFLAGDFSYGLYIVAFPVQQLVRLWLGEAAGFWTILCVSLPIALGLAMLSWHFVEKPFLRLKYRTGRLIQRTA
jgi:peptidoglycan/LPS O-acetylase OafA/YrhL